MLYGMGIYGNALYATWLKSRRIIPFEPLPLGYCGPEAIEPFDDFYGVYTDTAEYGALTEIGTYGAYTLMAFESQSTGSCNNLESIPSAF